ncbi:Uncharacterised protein [Serratia quinivorans]|nr:Uncharacterised protein [Serratia quinivorans]
MMFLYVETYKKELQLLVISLFVLCIIIALIKFIYYRLSKKELDNFYQNYVENNHPVPFFVVVADNFNFIGISLKAQWFRWLLNNRKIKLTRGVWMHKNTYEFVQTTASKKLQRWIRNDFRLLIFQGVLLILMCIISYFINKTKS